MKNSSKNKYLPLSQSNIWRKQKLFYRQNGIMAWSNNKMPFYATSNPYIADSYAQIIIRFFQDTISLPTYSDQEPIYILEMGTGTGMFSYHLIKKLLTLQQDLNLSHVKWQYIMSDIVSGNLEFWETQPNLRPYIEAGYIDFAIYDAEKNNKIQLKRSQLILTDKTFSNPLIAIANYVFDSLRHDFCYIKAGEIQIGMVNPILEIDNNINNQGMDIRAIDPEFHYSTVALPFYKQSVINNILAELRANVNNNHFILPIGPINCLENLLHMAKDQLLVLIADKGYSYSYENYKHAPTDIVIHHDAISLAVNFQALAQYTTLKKGSTYLSNGTFDINCAALLFGNNQPKFNETRTAINSQFERFNPGGLTRLHVFLNAYKQFSNPGLVLAQLNNTCWDTNVFNENLMILMQLTKHNTPYTLEDLYAILPKVANNFYYTPWAPDTLFNIGLLLQNLEDYQGAIDYYQRSISYFGRLTRQLHNMAICHYNLGQIEQARQLWYETLTLDSEHHEASGWLGYLTRYHNNWRAPKTEVSISIEK